MNERHLLYWVLRAIDEGFYTRTDLTDRYTWMNLSAPEWVHPAMCEAFADVDSGVMLKE